MFSIATARYTRWLYVAAAIAIVNLCMHWWNYSVYQIITAEHWQHFLTIVTWMKRHNLCTGFGTIPLSQSRCVEALRYSVKSCEMLSNTRELADFSTQSNNCQMCRPCLLLSGPWPTQMIMKLAQQCIWPARLLELVSAMLESIYGSFIHLFVKICNADLVVLFWAVTFFIGCRLSSEWFELDGFPEQWNQWAANICIYKFMWFSTFSWFYMYKMKNLCMLTVYFKSNFNACSCIFFVFTCSGQSRYVVFNRWSCEDIQVCWL